MEFHHVDGICQERWGFSWAMSVSGRVLQRTKNSLRGKLSVEQISYNKYWAISRPCKAKDKLLLRVLKSMKTRWDIWNPSFKAKNNGYHSIPIASPTFLSQTANPLGWSEGSVKQREPPHPTSPLFSPSGIRTKARRTSNKAWRIRYSPSSGRVLSTQNAVFWLFYLPAMFLVWQQHAFLRLPLPSTRYRNVYINII